MNSKTALAGGALLVGTSVFGLGLRIPDRDPEATGRGNAFVATADNPSAVYYNPAGITQLGGNQLRLGLYTIYLKSDADTAAGHFSTEDQVIPIPSIFYTFTPESMPLSFGLGIYSPFGLALKWPDAVPFRTLGREARILVGTINPVIAWKVHETLSIGAGPEIFFSKTMLETGLAVPGDNLRFEGDGWGIGFNAGVRWQPTARHAFGVTYRSAPTINYEGDTHLRVPFPPPFPPNQRSTAKIRFPQNIAAGYSFRPTEKWNLEADIEWTDWNRLNSIIIKQTPNLPFLLNWESSFLYELGVSRLVGNGYAVRMGYIYSEATVPEKTFRPLVPDMDRHFFSLGLGHQGKRWKWDLAYQVAYGPGRTISNPAGSPFAAANGHYDFLSHAINIGGGFHF